MVFGNFRPTILPPVFSFFFFFLKLPQKRRHTLQSVGQDAGGVRVADSDIPVERLSEATARQKERPVALQQPEAKILGADAVVIAEKRGCPAARPNGVDPRLAAHPLVQNRGARADDAQVAGKYLIPVPQRDAGQHVVQAAAAYRRVIASCKDILNEALGAGNPPYAEAGQRETLGHATRNYPPVVQVHHR